MDGSTILEAFARNAAEMPQRAAIIHGSRRISFAELGRRSIELAAGLAGAGVGRSTPVGVMMRGSANFSAACLALWRLGAIVVPIDISAPPEDRAARESIVELPFIFADHAVQALQAATRVLQIDSIARADAPGTGFQPGPDDDCLYMFTSGTTGRPKALTHTHASLFAMIRRNIALGRSVLRDDVVLATIPLQLGLGLLDLVTVPLVAGASVVLVEPFSARLALKEALAHGATTMVTVPGIIKLLAATPESMGTPRFRWVNVNSALLDAEVYERFHARFGIRPVRGYGMSEIGRIATTGLRQETAYRPIVGWPLVELRILDEQQNEVAHGETGEVAVRGPGLCRMECRLAGGMREPLPMAGDWFLTGDLGRLESDGALALVGRKKSFINGPRLRVNPREVEEVLLRIAGVRDAVVVPAPGSGGHDAIRAVIVADATLRKAAVAEFCGAHLPAGKRPQIIDFVDSIPRNASGKVELWRFAAAGPKTNRP